MHEPTPARCADRRREHAPSCASQITPRTRGRPLPRYRADPLLCIESSLMSACPPPCAQCTTRRRSGWYIYVFSLRRGTRLAPSARATPHIQYPPQPTRRAPIAPPPQCHPAHHAKSIVASTLQPNAACGSPDPRGPFASAPSGAGRHDVEECLA